MSEGPREDGWWQASDGLWYPPETHPAYTPPTGPIDLGRTPPEGVPLGPGAPTARLPGPPPAPPPPPGRQGLRSPDRQGARPAARTAPRPTRPPVPPPERRRAFGGGCLVALLATVGLAIVLVVGARYLIDRARQEAAEVPDAVGRAVDDAVDDVVGGRCDFLTDEQATAALGGGAKVVGLGSIASAARPALDARILPDATTCWVAAANGRVARVARIDAGDANARFDAAAAAAKRGPSPYHAGGVRGFRNEAFCTTLNAAGSSGVLARRGDALVYASVTPDLTRFPGFDEVADKVAADNCRTARDLATEALS